MQRQLRCLIADDEPLAVRLLEAYVDRCEHTQCAASCLSAREALDAIRRGGIDLAFLDIQMPDMTGLELARELAQSPVRVVFVTAYPDYALEGFRVNALDYLLKPVSYDEFAEAVRRACTAMPAPVADHMMVRSDYKLVKVVYDDILYVEGLKDYVKIYIAGAPRPIITQMSMKAVESALPADTFARVHRSFIVGLRHMTRLERGKIVIADRSIPVGDTYRRKLLERL